MQIKTLKLIAFSPTGTTRSVLQSIARGICAEKMELVDVTTPDARTRPLQTTEHDLLIVGAPVYGGRIPAVFTDWLQKLDARRTPAVAVVVYGNRAYEDALLELSDVLQSRGCTPIAGAAFIGEHSFSHGELPTAAGRPDADDLQRAEAFGRSVYEKLQAASTVSTMTGLNAPGNHPYGGYTKLWDVDFIAVSDDCVQCGVCAAACPVGAIDPDDSRAIDIVACITCCACIKGCPLEAKSIKPGQVMDAAKRLHNNFPERKAVQVYI